MEHVKEDIKNHIENNDDIELSDDDIDEIAYLYVYEGKYDCNFSYWDNIQNLIDYRV